MNAANNKCKGNKAALICENNTNNALAKLALNKANRQPSIKVTEVMPNICSSNPGKMPALICHKRQNTKEQASTPV